MSDLSLQAANKAISKTIKDAKAVKLSGRKALKRIAEGLDAMENKVFYDKDRGKCVIGPAMINWAARQKAIDQTICVLDMKPPEKMKVDHDVSGNLADMMRQHLAGSGDSK